MKIVIDIPDGCYEELTTAKFPVQDVYRLVAWVKDGTPLPKGHGRLIDADTIIKAIDTWDKFGFDHTGCFVRNPGDDFIKYVHYDDMVKSVRGAETIIEADKEE